MNNKSLAIHLFCLLLFVVGCGVFWMMNVDKNENENEDENEDENENVGVCQVIENKKNHITLEEKGRDTSHNTSIKNKNGGVADISPLSPSSSQLSDRKAESYPVERNTNDTKRDGEVLSSDLATIPDENVGFNPIGDNNQQAEKYINAVIHEQQNVSIGSKVKLRLLDDITINGVVVPKNMVVYAEANIVDERVFLRMETITYKRKEYAFNADIFDSDGEKGLKMSNNKAMFPAGYKVIIKNR